MSIFDGLEKFGLKSDGVDLFADEKEEEKRQEEEKKQEEVEPKEEEFLLEKTITCAVCDKQFKTLLVKSGRARRLEPDRDLRPRHMYIDTLKYGVVSCPYCGYSALTKYFEHISSGQRKMIREQICVNFSSKEDVLTSTYSYDKAIEMYKLALLNTVVKKGKTSEKAYICLMLAWLYRGMCDALEEEKPFLHNQIVEYRGQGEEFYQQAYEGMIKAMASETFPICGMDQYTLNYLIAVMAIHFKKYDTALKTLSFVITSKGANTRMKDRALELKDELRQFMAE